MQILILCSKFPYPLKDGGAIATYNLVKGLSNFFEKTYLLSFNTKKHFIKSEDIPSGYFNNIQFQNFYINTTVNILKAVINLLFSKKPYISNRFYNNKFSKTLIKVLNTNNFDIVQVEGLYMMQYADIIKKNSKALISYREHNIENEIWYSLAINNKNRLIKYYLNNLSDRILKYEKSIIEKFDVLVAISDNDKNKISEFGNSKPSITIPVGFEKKSITPLNENNDIYSLYFIGSLEWQPNTEGIIWFLTNCWENLKLKFPFLKFHIAGRNAPESFIEKINYKDVFFNGEVENINSFIKQKSIMIVPLLSGSGMRVKIIEAFMNRKAVVSTLKGTQGTKSENEKHLLIADNPEEFINKISELIENKSLYNKIINNAYNLYLKKFDNFELSKLLFNFYEYQVKQI